MDTRRLRKQFSISKPQLEFLKQWTWFDAKKTREFIAKGDPDGAGDWARSAARDVLSAPELNGLLPS